MGSRLEGKVLVAQGGGPTAVINQSLVGVVTEARKFSQVGRVYGAVNGIHGLVNEELMDLTQETTHNLEQVAATPASALLSTRDKPTTEYCERIFKTLKAHDVRYFFYIGGNDSSDTARIVNENAKAAKYELRCVHVPKTIDNDLVINDHTPGFGSAARFVSLAFMGVNLDNRALAGVYIAVVMGRHAGFLTAASSLGRSYEDDGPHLIYLPERPFSVEQFVGDVDRVYQRYGRCIVAVSEGIIDKDGQPIMTQLMDSVEKDAHGNVQLSGTGALGDQLVKAIKDRLNIKRVRSDTFGYLQRSFMSVVSDVDQQEAREVGEKAVQFALWHDVDGSVTIHRTGAYSVDYQLTPLEEIAAKTRHVPDEFINKQGNDVTEAFYAYARPLLGSGMPRSYRLRAPKVRKLLG
ncbi:MAG: 6-phosphofructokinase [Deltaproteobacteria bacterium]|nr:6-phosphofructokinase [Deltaproteobacteria bacterium]